jgi:hypothetical protein
MKSIRVILIALIAFAAIAAIILLRRSSSSDYDLKIPAGTALSKIILQSHNGRVVLEEKKGYWYLNGREEARKTAIDLLLAVIEDMEPKSPVSEGTVDLLKNKLAGSPVSVKIFSGNRQLRSFTVSHYNDVSYGSIFRKKRTALLFYLPGYDLDAGSVFIADKKYWRPFTIFKLMPSEIKGLSVNYPSDADKSFSILNDKGRVSMGDIISFDTVSVKRYLSYFVNVPFESINTSLRPAEVNNITSSTPFVSISVTSIGGDIHVLKGWKRSSDDKNGGTPDTDRLWGQLDNGNLFVMRYFDIDPLLKKRSYFQKTK